jgi:hypothetical protein
VEAARVPQQLLGELFVEKGLITREELAEALAEQKESGKRIGQILVMKGLVSRPDLTAVLAEQLGVAMEKQEGFGSGLWSEIRRRHPRVGRDEDADEPQEPVEQLDAHELRLAPIDDLEEGAATDPVDEEQAELENLRQQLSFASTRIEEERAGHKGTLRLLDDSRRELERLAREVDDWRERAARGEGSEEKEQAVAQLAELEATVTELRGELEARERELAAGAEVQTQLQGSKDAIAALTAQVDEQRAGAADSQRLLDEARAEADALEATVAGLRSELDKARNEGSESQAAVAALTVQFDEQRASCDELEQRFEEARADSAAFEATIAELREELSGRETNAKKSERKLGELRAELAAGEEARSREAAARDAAENQLAQLQADALALSHSLEEAKGAHVAARREVGRLESRCAELEPLEALLAQANADVAARTHSIVELTAELAAVQAELAERREPPPVEEPPASHVAFLPSAKGYALVELPGPTPNPGAYEDVDEMRFVVSRIGPSPLPADRRRCAFLEVA